MSVRSKRELLAQVAGRYREAGPAQKRTILDEFVAATGYARKYAIRLFAHPVPPLEPIRRRRARRYGLVVQEALAVCWSAANGICAKRLTPFLPELVPALERHGHLALGPEERTQLLTISAATADRLLRPHRERDQPHGLTTTKPGALLKRQIPVRTFQDWNDARPGCMEIDLVAHCGWSTEGAFLQTLVLTDVATGWTECLPLLYRSQQGVIAALDHARQLLPFPLVAVDTDNGGEFLNGELFSYCGREHITFTRGRTGKKNDQCFVEQKNGSIVRQLVGYDRFEGAAAYRQLSELYRAVRLYVNVFQPSMKLATKRREGSAVHRTDEPAKTPLRRLFATAVLAAAQREQLEAIAQALDPVRLLRQLEVLQDALWRHAIFRTPAPAPLADTGNTSTPPRFAIEQCGLGQDTAPDLASDRATAVEQPRKYRRTAKVQAPRWWRTRADPFAEDWEDIVAWLAADPARTAMSVFLELEQRFPGRYRDGQLRTLQRRVQEWRARSIVVFDQQWLQDEVFATQTLPGPLRVLTMNQDGDPTSPMAASQ